MPEPKNSKPSVEPQIEVNKIRRRIDTCRQSSIDAFIAQIALLQRYLSTKGVPREAGQELDEFIMDVQDRWAVTAEVIEDILER